MYVLLILTEIDELLDGERGRIELGVGIKHLPQTSNYIRYPHLDLDFDLDLLSSPIFSLSPPLKLQSINWYFTIAYLMALAYIHISLSLHNTLVVGGSCSLCRSFTFLLQNSTPSSQPIHDSILFIRYSSSSQYSSPSPQLERFLNRI